MKTRSTITALATACAVCLGSTAFAQADDQVSYTPEHAWEVGLHGGYAFLSGDLDQDPGFGVGLHVRRALDHIFSLRVDVDYVRLNSTEATGGRPFRDVEATTFGGSAQGVVTVNNLKFDKPSRKINLYIFGGPGASTISIEGTSNESGQTVDIVEDRDLNGIQFFADVGAGIAFKVSPKFNIGLEHKAMVPFGKTADLFDGDRNVDNPGTSYRDIPNFTNVRLNFNLGNLDEIAEPLYWVNPLNQVIEDLTELKARPELDLTDSDGDGVIDMIDQDNETPEGADVDPRGLALDSDNDGIPNYEDGEPYSPPGAVVDATGISQDPGYQTRPQVEELIAGALTDYQNSEAANRMEDWFLPMIHFGLNSYTVRKADYGHLKNIATVMRANPNVQVVVQGYTDKLASDDYNRVLSYNRAKSAKEYLVNRYGIDAGRLLINFDGESDVLVPTNTGSFMNRRVEFRVATTEDMDMPAPDGPKAGSGTFFSGSRDAGY